MRLAKLKLAGFKSFVDPTSVALPGQLVGVVGPNGCGKSNIMDAVRWVLGESKASELRGESMQDVIFNGSTNRKPVARASVELVFDNALGRALGQWSQYTELAVKRVLARSGQSDYFINNLKVRRKDITDLFLGTGLGPRAYAIIGQGMISRIIEARPDDLRVFLEEAAGVTRYKERRRETGRRLEDTRENLARVEDIRLELATQTERLEAQAEVARQYHDHNQQLTEKQQLLWLLRRNEAQGEQARLALEVGRAEAELEGATASLRETETRLEHARQTHDNAGEALHQAQGAFYHANAEVARLEAEIRHRREVRLQLETRLARLAQEESHWQQEAEKLAQDRGRWEELRLHAAQRLEVAEARCAESAASVPQAEEDERGRRAEVERLRREIAQAEQRLQVELAHRSHAQRSLETLRQRREKARRDLELACAPDAGELAAQEEALQALEAQHRQAQMEAEALRERLPEAEARRRETDARLQQERRAIAAAEARQRALAQMQEASGADLAGWLARHGLTEATPLWRQLTVEAGWENAVESVLRERLNALPAPASSNVGDWETARPGGRLTLRLPPVETVAAAHPPSSTPDASDAQNAPDVPGRISPHSLRARLALADPAWAALLDEWFAPIYTAASLADALARREKLTPGTAFVTPAGDRVERGAVSFFAPEAAAGHGLLERQREIDALGAQLAERLASVAALEAELAGQDETLRETRATADHLRREAEETRRQAHAQEVEVLRLSQAQERRRAETARLEAALAEFVAEEEAERERELEAGENIAQWREEIEALRQQEYTARTHLEETGAALRVAREAHAACEREARDAQFSRRECESQLAGIVSGLQVAERELTRIRTDLAACAQQKQETPPELCEESLAVALAARDEREAELARQRDALEAARQALRELEEARLRVEQAQEPLRVRIGELKLKEQAAALNAEQLAGQLAEAGADEARLTAALPGAKPQALAQEIGRLQKAILELGAVNLAALEELESARERQGYLERQANDLVEAMETLENAIRRIDRETRELLQSTFDTVNAHFGQLFPELFGGGKAALVMTGEEILDAGVQVFAQPPGKKNSTIHLLSGGEKALTAIALVFSMFQLNPAPFCLLDEVDAPLDDTNTERFCQMVRKMSGQTQFLFISHNKIAMEMANQLVGVTMQESGVSRVVEVDMETALQMRESA
ncbi:MAG: chromosome segregation protein SMC [Zoogloeaceae bacterium]|jgi:chromosome segregation protein|nr:chromosome segregation protein SMC [Zoogloeaceae bacterium]